jgi:hypothetical protein
MTDQRPEMLQFPMPDPSQIPTPELIALLVGTVNALLLVVLIGVAWFYGRRKSRLLERAKRKLVALRRDKKGLQLALNSTVEQFKALRRRFSKAATVAERLPARVPFIVPPPLSLTPPSGDDGLSWEDNVLRTQVHPRARQLGLNRTIPLPPELARELIRDTIPPPPLGPSVLVPTPCPPGPVSAHTPAPVSSAKK